MFYQQEVKEVMQALSSSEKGLSSSEAKKRQKKYGLNSIEQEKKIPYLSLLVQQFNDPLVWVLLFAILLSFLIQHMVDALIIAIILILNAGFGFFQEYKAEKAILLLRKLRAYESHVLRDGKHVVLNSDFLVPGDVILLHEGDRMPADCRLIEVHSFSVDEASLTGESTPVQKQAAALGKELSLAERTNMVFAGTAAVHGSAVALVVETDQRTELGKIAQALENIVEEPTPLQKKLKEIGKILTLGVVFISLLVFFLGLLRSIPLVEMFLVAVSLAVAAIPEGLPAVVTITLALGLRRMLKRKALIRKLHAVESLGSVTVICSDKTGTLTRNELSVTTLFSSFKEFAVTGVGYSLKGDILFEGKNANSAVHSLLQIAATCNDATVSFGDPTERALLVLAEKGKVKALERKIEVPFSSDLRYMQVRGEDGTLYVKGAAEVVLAQCSLIAIEGSVRKLRAEDRKIILAKVNLYSSQALRVLAFASGKDALIFSGIAGMIDLPRKGVKEAIHLCEGAGIRCLMITGDHILTAEAIAKQVGIQGKAVSGEDIDAMSDSDLRRIMHEVRIFARVDSSHKARILRALQANKEIVAMTGDGVNDALALKQADVGVAMNIKGTDVSKDVSDLILLDDHFSTIAAAVEEGRIIYANIQKFVKYLLAANFGEVALVFFSLLGGLPLPLLPVQLLWVNLVTDSFPALALGVDPPEPGVMRQKPRNPKESFFKGMGFFFIAATVLSLALTLGLFLYYNSLGDIMKTRTVVLTALVFFELFLVYALRSDTSPLWKLQSNWYIHAAVLFSIVLHLFLLYSPLQRYFSLVPLTLYDWLLIAPFSLSGLFFFEFVKYVKHLKERRA